MEQISVPLIAVLLAALWSRKEAATMIDYSLMLGLVAAVCLAAVTVLGTQR